MEKLNIATICDRIAVQAPYFAFDELARHDDGAVRGVFTSEQQIGYERGPVVTAEVGRHLAILGSCAAVAGRDIQRTYYLATHARYSMINEIKHRGIGQTFSATAEVLSLNKRALQAQAIISAEVPFAYLTCEYQALPESVFMRLFQDYRREPGSPPLASPYREPIHLKFEEPQGMQLTAHSEGLSPTRCAGHFPQFPAWPVAIMAETAAQVTARLLHHIVGKEVRYSVLRVELSALKLVSASQPLEFQVNCLSASRALSHYTFSAQAMQGSEVAFKMKTELTVG